MCYPNPNENVHELGNNHEVQIMADRIFKI